jgi:negative regulator of flagellin synthesis FlgM
MKIHDVNRAGAIRQYRRNVDLPGGKAGKTGPLRDEVRISSEAKGLLEAGQARAERIQELKRSIESGTYHVDARKIAEKLLPYLWK